LTALEEKNKKRGGGKTGEVFGAATRGLASASSNTLQQLFSTVFLTIQPTTVDVDAR
jgi:hypothetical protein